jgi:hypothetical protein
MLFLLAPAGAGAQEREVPPDAKYKVIDIVFKVESFGGQVVDLQVKETETEVRIELAADVLFDFDQATLLPKAEDTLKKAAEFIGQRAKGIVLIEGHTDSKGDDAYNQKLSERRADPEMVRAQRPGRSSLLVQGTRRDPAGGAECEARRRRRSRGAAKEPSRRNRDQQELRREAWLACALEGITSPQSTGGRCRT